MNHYSYSLCFSKNSLKCFHRCYINGNKDKHKKLKPHCLSIVICAFIVNSKEINLNCICYKKDEKENAHY